MLGFLIPSYRWQGATLVLWHFLFLSVCAEHWSCLLLQLKNVKNGITLCVCALHMLLGHIICLNQHPLPWWIAFAVCNSLFPKQWHTAIQTLSFTLHAQWLTQTQLKLFWVEHRVTVLWIICGPFVSNTLSYCYWKSVTDSGGPIIIQYERAHTYSTVLSSIALVLPDGKWTHTLCDVSSQRGWPLCSGEDKMVRQTGLNNTMQCAT